MRPVKPPILFNVPVYPARISSRGEGVPVDFELFRGIVGSFPTGVSVVTALDADGVPRGLTSNALCSVSADPPLLLVCVDKQSQTLPAMQASNGFVVNFLAAGREVISNRFASKDPDKFSGLKTQPSQIAGGAPILVDDVVAYAECVKHEVIEAGDHWIFVGRVEGGAVPGGTPLMYYRRTYAAWPVSA